MKIKKLRKRKVNKNNYDLLFGDKYLGSLIRDVDGFFYYLPSIESGTWTAYSLRGIADILDELNKKWNEEIDKYFKEHG